MTSTAFAAHSAALSGRLRVRGDLGTGHGEPAEDQPARPAGRLGVLPERGPVRLRPSDVPGEQIRLEEVGGAKRRGIPKAKSRDASSAVSFAGARAAQVTSSRKTTDW